MTGKTIANRSPGAQLRKILAHPGCAMAVGAYDPAVAKLVERSGFPAVYVSGSASSTAVAGFSDIGLLSFKEMLDNARNVIAATRLPTLCDIDTGYGGLINVKRTIREYEQVGAAGVHLEDQTFPKRCGQTTGASLIAIEDMCAKIAAAKEAQTSDDFVLVVRTDARQSEGMDAAVRRGRAYIEAGADALFPEALLTSAEFKRARAELNVPLVTDVPEVGAKPDNDDRRTFRLGIRPGDLRPVKHAGCPFCRTRLPQRPARRSDPARLAGPNDDTRRT